MTKQRLEKLKAWFKEYVKGFYCNDAYINANIKLKEVHTLKVCEIMCALAEDIGLGEKEAILAEAIALLHDIGRFEQFVKYKTYHDGRSVDHSAVGLDVLKTKNILDGLEEDDKRIIFTAIKCHGIKELPASLDKDVELYAKLIRDADKIDIYRVVIENYRAYLADPKTFLLEVELPDKEWYSQEVVESVINGRRLPYSKLKTLNDMKLLQLGWVFDMNFAATFKILKKRRCIEELAEFLPQTEDVKRAVAAAVGYVDEKIR